MFCIGPLIACLLSHFVSTSLFLLYVLEQDGNSPGRDWQGVQSLPRQVVLDPQLKVLRTSPLPEVDQLRLVQLAEVRGAAYKYKVEGDGSKDDTQTGSEDRGRGVGGVFNISTSGLALDIEVCMRLYTGSAFSIVIVVDGQHTCLGNHFLSFCHLCGFDYDKKLVYCVDSDQLC